MSDLRRLDEIVQKVDDKITFKKDLSKPYVGLEHIATKSSYLSGFSEANTSISTNAVFSAGDVLFGKLRPNLRKCVVAPFDGYCSTDILVLRAKSDVCNRFAGRVFQTEKIGSAAEMTAIGTKMPRTSWTHLKEVEVYYPDRHNQEVIANILDTLDTTIRQTEATIAKLQQIKQGLLYDLLTRGIDANGQLRPPVEQAPHLYKESPLGWIPREWTTKLFKQLFFERTRNGLYKPSSHHGSGPLMVQMGGLFRGEEVDFSSATRVRVSPSELSAFGLADGDLLFARRSLVFEGAGQCVIVHNLPEASTFESSIVRVRVERSQLLPEFAAVFLSSPASYANRRTFIRQVAVSGVSSADISQFLIVVPPIQEQKAIVERCDAIKYRINRELLEVEKLLQQKSALMDDLLTGRVRVTALLSGETPAPKELERESA